MSTRIVVLDVVVTDKQGHTINNLTKDDFTIYEDGQAQRIRSFEAPEEHTSPAPGKLIVRSTADLSKIGQSPVTMLVLDELNTSFEDMAFARERMEKYLNAQPAILTQPTTLLAATNTKFDVIQDFTQDRAAVLAALRKHMPEIPWKMRKSGADSSGAFERMSQSLNSLYQMAEATRGTPGRKTVIWVGKGFPAVNLVTLDGESTIKLQDAIKKLTQALLDSRITLYTIDPESTLTNQAVISTTDDLADFESQSNGQPFEDEIKFSTLAPATGGQALFSRNDIDAELQESTAQGTHYYTISYSPTNASQDEAKYRHIRIKVNRPGLIATTRDGYYPAPPSTPAADIANKTREQVRAELEAEMGKAAMGSITYNGVNASISAAADGSLHLAIPAGDLAWVDASEGKTRAEITVIEVAFSSKGKALAHISKELSAEIVGRVANPEQKAVFILPRLNPQGTTRTRVVVRDVQTGKIGTAELP